jgi:hypothetical protein
VAVDSRGDVYLAGISLNTFDGNPPLGSSDIFLSKYSAAGVKLGP